MRNLWNIVSFIAVVNLLALVMFLAWLGHSGRLTSGRMLEIRDLLSTTQDEQAEQEALAVAQQEQTRRDAEEKARREDPPLPSAAQVSRDWMVGEATRQALRRLREETRQHQVDLELRARQLDAREASLEDRRKAWEASIGDERTRKIDAQFQKTVKLYESLAGKQAKRMLLELVKRGEPAQAVAYLDAMNPRAAARTLKALKTESENELATELLERLRTFGVEAEVAQDAGHDPSPSLAQ